MNARNGAAVPRPVETPAVTTSRAGSSSLVLWNDLQGPTGFGLEWFSQSGEGGDGATSRGERGCLELWLNLEGQGLLETEVEPFAFFPRTACLCFSEATAATMRRSGAGPHVFARVALSREFVRRHFGASAEVMTPAVPAFLAGEKKAACSALLKLSGAQQRLVQGLCSPSVPEEAKSLWWQAKVLELAAELLFEAEASGELFCERYKRHRHERVERVIAILRDNLADPPALEEIGRRAGCSPFHLSRIFSQEMGCGIFQYLRRLRMDRAAQLLRGGKLNVTQVALEVGYSSPSHFSTAFHQAFGCCPGLYPYGMKLAGLGKTGQRRSEAQADESK